MLSIPVTEQGNSKVKIPLGRTTYTFAYKYNTRNKRIYLSIYLGDEAVITGLRLVEFGAPLINYAIEALEDFELGVFRISEGSGFATLGNFGDDKEFSLLALTEDDIVEIFA